MKPTILRHTIFQTFFILVIMLFVCSSVRSASVCVPTPVVPGVTPVLAPGINCGNAMDPCANACCYAKTKIQFPIINDPTIIAFLNLWHIPNPADIIQTIQREVTSPPCTSGQPSTPYDLSDPQCVCVQVSPSPYHALQNACNNISSSTERTQCLDCIMGTNNSGKNTQSVIGIWTGVGCLQASMSDFIQKTVFGWGIGLAGGISFLTILYAAFMMQTSGGNAEKLKKANELISSAIVGLILIIFSIFILRVIGINILGIPGFM